MNVMGIVRQLANLQVGIVNRMVVKLLSAAQCHRRIIQSKIPGSDRLRGMED